MSRGVKSELDSAIIERGKRDTPVRASAGSVVLAAAAERLMGRWTARATNSGGRAHGKGSHTVFGVSLAFGFRKSPKSSSRLGSSLASRRVRRGPAARVLLFFVLSRLFSLLRFAKWRRFSTRSRRRGTGSAKPKFSSRKS